MSRHHDKSWAETAGILERKLGEIISNTHGNSKQKASFWIILGQDITIPGSSWVRFGVLLGSSWGPLGVLLGSSWGYVCVILVSFRGHLGIVFEAIMGSLWDNFGVTLGGVLGNFLFVEFKFKFKFELADPRNRYAFQSFNHLRPIHLAISSRRPLLSVERVGVQHESSNPLSISFQSSNLLSRSNLSIISYGWRT